MKIIKINTSKDIPKNYTGMVECPDGTKLWLLNGKYHKENGPAIEYSNGDKLWYSNGKIHREDGPAAICANGDEYWFVNGKRHREDGPASISYYNGHKNHKKIWYLNGKELNKEKIEQLIKLEYPESTAIKLSSL